MMKTETSLAMALHCKVNAFVAGRPTFLRHGPQLQQVPVQPSPQEPRQLGQTHTPEALALCTSSPWRLRKHI